MITRNFSSWTPWNRNMSSAWRQNGNSYTTINGYLPPNPLTERKEKLSLFYKGKKHEAYLAHVKVQITASRKNIYLVLVYSITDHPIILATNKEVKSKDEVVRIAKLYFSRCPIKEYFRWKNRCFNLKTSGYGSWKPSTL